LFPADEGSQTAAAGRFQATAGRALMEHLIDRQRLGEALEARAAERLAGKEPAEELERRRTDHQGIGRGHPLQPSGEVRGLAERQSFMAGVSLDLPTTTRPV